MSIKRVAQFTLFNLFLASFQAHADSAFNLTEGVSPVSHDIYQLHMTILWICVGIGIIVFGTMIYTIMYHRKSLGVKPARFHEHVWLEITWTLVPFIILTIMAIFATKVLIHMHDFSDPDLTIKITGYQWKWHYDYLDSDIHFFSNNATPDDEIHGKTAKDEHYLRTVDHPLVLPIHKKIRFLITANDVIHGWWVPALGVKQDAIPGFINAAWTEINRPGIYYGQCSKLCGMHHAYMPIVVIAMTEKDFSDWITLQKTGAMPAPVAAPSASTTTTPVVTTKTLATVPAPAKTKPFTLYDLMGRGEKIYQGTCSVCHKPDGSGMPPTFPAMKGSKTATGPVSEHIKTVLNGRPGTAMQAFKDQFSDEDLAAVITYERNAFGNNTNTMVQPADIAAARK